MRFYNDLEVPISGESDSIPVPENGFLKLIVRNGIAKLIDNSGNEISIGINSIVTKSENYSIIPTDNVILVNSSTGQKIITLPNPLSSKGLKYNIKKIDSSLYSVRVNPYSNESIDGKSFKLIKGQYSSMQIVSDGTNWYII